MLKSVNAPILKHQEAPPKPKSRFGLAARVLVLIAAFVMLTEIAIYVPSIANFRNNWLRNRLSAGYTAALVLEAAPSNMVPESLSRELLDSVGARLIVLKLKDSRRMLAASSMPPRIDEICDLRAPGAYESVMAAFRALTSDNTRVLNIIGDAPMGGDFIEVTMDEAPLKLAMKSYSINILLLSLAISAIVGLLAMVAIHLMVLRPVKHLTSSLMRFGKNPEDASRIIKPSGRGHELGRAEEALQAMQQALSHELKQKKHLAALGLAVAKINHDLRNMLAPAQLLSDRLADVPDPLVQRLAPKLVGTLDRAIRFAEATLVYGRAADEPPKKQNVSLRQVVAEVAETLAPVADERIEIRNDVPEQFQIFADGEQIFRVLMNLCRNAIQALENAGPSSDSCGRVSIEALISDATTQTAGSAIILVSDNGPGVSLQAREKLFEAFQGSTRIGGTGLGLAIAADLIRAHGGELALVTPTDSTATGATFRISLPLL